MGLGISQADPKDTVNLIANLAEDNGHVRPQMKANYNSGGWYLQDHYTTNQGMEIWGFSPWAGYPTNSWNYIIYQEHSLGNLNPEHGGSPANMTTYINLLNVRTRLKGPNAVNIMYQTWSRGYGSFYPYMGIQTPDQMNTELRNNYYKKGVEFQCRVAPVGECLKLVNWNSSYYNPDTIHMNAKGQLFVVFVLYTTIYMEQPQTNWNFSRVKSILGVTDQDIQNAVSISNTATYHLFHSQDFNRDGMVNPDDLGDFVTEYFSVNPGFVCDYNKDGQLNPDDLGDFITDYYAF